MPKQDSDRPIRLGSLTSVLRRLAPWIVALAAFGWLIRNIHFAELRAALERISLPTFLAIVAAYVTGTLLTDSLATWAIIPKTVRKAGLGYFEMLRIRGATYLLAIVNYGVGQGGVAYFLNRRHGMPLGRSAGLVLLTTGVNLMMVAACATIGILFGGTPTSAVGRLLVLGLAGSFPAYLAVIALKPAVLVRRAVLAPLFEAGVSGHLVAAAVRIPHIATLIAGNYTAMHLFGVTPPLSQAMVLLPLVFVVSALPISPSGLGTGQAMAVTVFSPFAVGTVNDRHAAVLAYSLSLQFVTLACDALIGFVCLSGLLKDDAAKARAA